tara:strand:+ start:16 stop:645 length:630 start_codon:yes stop_codon:yes gene_type:complete
MKLQLIYPDLPFWRAETSRIALFIGGIEFEDIRPSRDEIKKMKSEGVFPFGQFPILKVDGKTIAQTGAIARFCGKLSGLYPTDNNFYAAKVDEVLDLATDITFKIRPALKEKNSDKSILMRRELVENILPIWLGFMETLLEMNGKKGYFVNDSLTVADLAAWRLCGWISGGIIDGIPENILDNFPLLVKHQYHISKFPKILEWVEKKHK